MVTLVIVLAEISIALAVVLAVIGVRALRRRRLERAAAVTLATRIKTNAPARVEKLAGALRSGGGLNDEDALAKANELIKMQNKFYREAIDLYFTRSHDLLSKLDGRLEALLSHYQVMIVPGEGAAGAVDEALTAQLSDHIAALGQDLETLRQENAVLVEQLKAAEHELDQLGREYVSAFNKPKVARPHDEKPPESEAVPPDSLAESTVTPPPAIEEDDRPAPEAIAREEAAAPQGHPAGDAAQPFAVAAHGHDPQELEGDEEEGGGILTDLDLDELLVEPDAARKSSEG